MLGGHCHRCWEIIMTQPVSSSTLLEFTVSQSVGKPLPHVGATSRRFYLSLLPKTYFLSSHCCWNHPFPPRYSGGPFFIFKTSTAAMSPIILLVLAPAYSSVFWGTNQGDTWSFVKLLIPGHTPDVLSDQSHWSGNKFFTSFSSTLYQGAENPWV